MRWGIDLSIHLRSYENLETCKQEVGFSKGAFESSSLMQYFSIDFSRKFFKTTVAAAAVAPVVAVGILVM